MHGIILFDGECNLCSGVVQFIIPRDPKGYFKFASLQSDSAKKLLEKTDTTINTSATMVLLVPRHPDRSEESRGEMPEYRVYMKSDALLRIAQKLCFPWSLMRGFLIIPGFIRNFFYMIISRNRYRWFGKRNTCIVPTPETENRFLDQPITNVL